jgi:5-methylcytosine-specific restriction protein A
LDAFATDADDSFFEGAVSYVPTIAYERNRTAREACLAHHGCNCAACGMSFGETYGPKADGFIHVHHRIPLASIGAEYAVDPVKDLIPLCPNCHAVIHMGGGMTLDDVRQLLQSRRGILTTS